MLGNQDGAFVWMDSLRSLWHRKPFWNRVKCSGVVDAKGLSEWQDPRAIQVPQRMGAWAFVLVEALERLPY